jgi:cytoskeletal protein CcmA (bactofilin family)
MTKIATKTVFTIGLLTLLMAVPAFGASVNKSIRVGDGEESGGATTVNGSITVGSDAVVTGGLRTVNGSIRVGSGSTIENAKTVNGSLTMAEGVETRDLGTVNGAITLGERSSVDGDVSAVNGSITLEKSAVVTGEIGNVNGKIRVDGATVEGKVKTVTGDVRLHDAVLKDDLLIEEPGMWSNSGKKRKPRIIIGPGSRIEGDIVIEHEVELFISESAEVGSVTGVMSLDDATMFSGDEP